MTSTAKLRSKNYVIKANGSITIDGQGTLVMLRTTTGNAGDLLISFGNSADNTFDAGDKYQMPAGFKFDSFTVTNSSGADITAKIAVGEGNVTMSNAVSITNTVTTSEKPANGSGAIADVTLTNGVATLILPLDLTRTSAVIVNDPANAKYFRVGPATVDGTHGAKVQVGQPYTHNSTAALYGFADVAGLVVSGTYETRT